MGIELRNAALWSFTSLSLTICYCGGYGIDCNEGCVFLQSSSFCILHSNRVCGIQATSGYCTVGKLSIKGGDGGVNSTVGAISMSNGAELTVAPNYQSIVSMNRSHGISVAGATTLSFTQAYCMQNHGHGLIMDGGIAWVSGSNLTGNGLAGGATYYSIYLMGPGSSVTALSAATDACQPPRGSGVANTWITG
jgi:hypothetical protein